MCKYSGYVLKQKNMENTSQRDEKSKFRKKKKGKDRKKKAEKSLDNERDFVKQGSRERQKYFPLYLFTML